MSVEILKILGKDDNFCIVSPTETESDQLELRDNSSNLQSLKESAKREQDYQNMIPRKQYIGGYTPIPSTRLPSSSLSSSPKDETNGVEISEIDVNHKIQYLYPKIEIELLLYGLRNLVSRPFIWNSNLIKKLAYRFLRKILFNSKICEFFFHLWLAVVPMP